jgi:hypothetical protein
MLKVILADWSYDCRINLLGMQFKSSEGAKGRKPFGLERLHIGTIGAFCDLA